MARRVLDVGNCVPDYGAIRSLMERQFGAEVVQTHGPDDTLHGHKRQRSNRREREHDENRARAEDVQPHEERRRRHELDARTELQHRDRIRRERHDRPGRCPAVEDGEREAGADLYSKKCARDGVAKRLRPGARTGPATPQRSSHGDHAQRAQADAGAFCEEQSSHAAIPAQHGVGCAKQHEVSGGERDRADGHDPAPSCGVLPGCDGRDRHRGGDPEHRAQDERHHGQVRNNGKQHVVAHRGTFVAGRAASWPST